MEPSALEFTLCIIKKKEGQINDIQRTITMFFLMTVNKS